MEPEVLELNDGRVLMIVRTQLGEIYASYSNDRGESLDGRPALGHPFTRITSHTATHPRHG